ncbi:MAG: hypothetical protein M1819_003970 [Sarea resinae]|nr:MAG: hypothetical protein M1819_003970 [Sarea resinae]
MTGLDPSTDSILQIACFITDAQLNVLDPTGFSAIIQHSQTRLAAMDEWCTRTHASTGLTRAALASTTTAPAAAAALLAYIKTYIPTAGRAMLAGNSVHADRAFLARAPYDAVLAHLHYRILDVSSIKEAARRWASDEALAAVPPKKLVHEAREDVLESIVEARYYRARFFSSP